MPARVVPQQANHLARYGLRIAERHQHAAVVRQQFRGVPVGRRNYRFAGANVPVVCDGIPVTAGDIVVADADGVVVVPREIASEVAQLGEQRRDKEEKTRERLRNGELGVDFYGLRTKLAELGVEYVDERGS